MYIITILPRRRHTMFPAKCQICNANRSSVPGYSCSSYKTLLPLRLDRIPRAGMCYTVNKLIEMCLYSFLIHLVILLLYFELKFSV